MCGERKGGVAVSVLGGVKVRKSGRTEVKIVKWFCVRRRGKCKGMVDCILRGKKTSYFSLLLCVYVSE